MRLIDADALIKKANEEKPIGRFTLVEYLKNAPTIEINTNDIQYAYDQGFKSGYGLGKEERPHGKWCEMPTKNTDYISIGKHYYCSICGEEVWGEYEKSNYCPNCGAKMDGGVDDGKVD